jgi:hypothetical protein
MTPLLCIAWFLCGQVPADIRIGKSEGAVEFAARLSAALNAKLPAGTLTQDQGEEWLRLCLINANTGKPGPAMFGAYEHRGTELLFRPRVQLEAGQLYRAYFGADKDSVTADYLVPSRTAGRVPGVVKVLPSGDVLPANHLKFYIYFSQPMRGGQAIFKQIAIVDDDDKEVYDPWLHDEIWDEKTCCLILYIHPGRIKWGIALRELLGPVLMPNRRYRLVIRGDMLDAEGQRLGKDFVKTFRTIDEDRNRIDLAAWKVGAPAAGTREPLKVRMPASIDHRALAEYLTITDATGKRIEGTVAIGKDEKAWTFQPAQAWSAQDYRLNVHAELEDVAGNTPQRPFDLDLKAPRLPAQQLHLPFRPVAAASPNAHR